MAWNSLFFCSVRLYLNVFFFFLHSNNWVHRKFNLVAFNLLICILVIWLAVFFHRRDLRKGSLRRKKQYLSFPDLHNTSVTNKSCGGALTMSTCRRNFLLEVTHRLSRDVTFYKHVVAYNSEFTYWITLHIISLFEY